MLTLDFIYLWQLITHTIRHNIVLVAFVFWSINHVLTHIIMPIKSYFRYSSLWFLRRSCKWDFFRKICGKKQRFRIFIPIFRWSYVRQWTQDDDRHYFISNSRKTNATSVQYLAHNLVSFPGPYHWTTRIKNSINFNFRFFFLKFRSVILSEWKIITS